MPKSFNGPVNTKLLINVIREENLSSAVSSTLSIPNSINPVNCFPVHDALWRGDVCAATAINGLKGSHNL